MEPRPIQRDLMTATEIIALSHGEEDDPFQASCRFYYWPWMLILKTVLTKNTYDYVRAKFRASLFINFTNGVRTRCSDARDVSIKRSSTYSLWNINHGFQNTFSS